MSKRISSRVNFYLQTLLTFLILCLLQITTWIPLRYWGAWGGGNFLDTWQILRYGKCYETVGLSVYENVGTNCSNYLYGRSLLQFLSFLNIDTSWTQAIGYIFLFLLATSMSLILPIQSRSDFLLFAAVVLSPPLLLLADRGNFDILIFFILIVVAKSVARGNFYLAFILLAITSLLKFYTIPVFFLLIVNSKRLKEKVFGSAALLIVTLLSIRDIGITQTDYPHGSDVQFGFLIWGEYLHKYASINLNPMQQYLVSFAVLGSAFLVAIYLYGETIKSEFRFRKTPAEGNWQTPALQIFLLVSISCYFGGMNFDYRLVYLAAAMLMVKRIIANYYFQHVNSILVVILWLSFPSGGLQPMGDLVIEVVAAYVIIAIAVSLNGKLRCRLRKNKSLY